MPEELKAVTKGVASELHVKKPEASWQCKSLHVCAFHEKFGKREIKSEQAEVARTERPFQAQPQSI